MLESIPVCLAVGAVLGFLAGLGVGGGSLLMLWMTAVLGMPHTTARIINLMFFIPTAVAASFFRWKQGKLPLKKILPIIAAGCIAAAVFSLISKSINTDILRKLFGALFLLTGIREILYRPRNAR